MNTQKLHSHTSGFQNSCARVFISWPIAVFAGIAACLSCCSDLWATTYAVNAKSGPWQYVSGGLNSAYQFGINDHLAPTVVPVTAGTQVSISYASGSINIASTGYGPANSYVDARGVLALPNPDLSPHYNGDMPSIYMNESASSPKYLGELVGTFSGSTGQLVGSPFAIGNGPFELSVPPGAVSLQLGVNDNLFADNVGTWSINVVPVPEPTALAFLCAGALALRAVRKRR